MNNVLSALSVQYTALFGGRSPLWFFDVTLAVVHIRAEGIRCRVR